MKYLSVCSGIEAATVAWHSLGWKPVAFSEIDPFPCKVLAHHYPDVPNFGDMTKFKEWPDANVDVLVGGTPCQSFSIAGLRKGLDDPRGNLMLTYLAIAAKYQPRWLVWENVPGVLSSNGGRDFASLLRGMGQLGYGFAYRVLDAQYFGVPQRRRRVFVVGCLGDWRSAATVLFERHSLSGNPPPSREKRQEVTEVAGTLSANGGGLSRPAGNANELDFCVTTCSGKDVFGTLMANCGTKQWLGNQKALSGDFHVYGIAGNIIGRKPENGGNGEGISPDVGYTLTKTDVHGVAYGVSEKPDVAPCQTKTDRHAVAYSVATHEVAGTMMANKDSGGFSNSIDHAAAGYMALTNQPATAFKVRGGCEGSGKGYLGSEDAAFTVSTNQDQHLFHKMSVRRLTPLECHRLQGFPDHYLHQVPGASDSSMYKALGNSMAVPVMRWIGERIQMVQDIQLDRVAA